MNILLAFLPFLSFALLERTLGTTNALWVAAGVSAILVARETVLGRKSLKPLEAGSFLLFSILAITSMVPQWELTVLGVRLTVDAGLLALILFEQIRGRPFTLAYAREKVSTEKAALPAFLALNRQLSAIWAGAFAVIVAADLAMMYWTEFSLGLGAGIIFASLAMAAAATVILPERMARGR